jgi:hypothetical protein
MGTLVSQFYKNIKFTFVGKGYNKLKWVAAKSGDVPALICSAVIALALW